MLQQQKKNKRKSRNQTKTNLISAKKDRTGWKVNDVIARLSGRTKDWKVNNVVAIALLFAFFEIQIENRKSRLQQCNKDDSNDDQTRSRDE